MKIDINKKHPFTAVNISLEDEYLCEEEIIELRKEALHLIHIIYFVCAFSIISSLCFFVDLSYLHLASKLVKRFAIVSYGGYLCLLISLILLFIQANKINKLIKKYDDVDKNNS